MGKNSWLYVLLLTLVLWELVSIIFPGLGNAFSSPTRASNALLKYVTNMNFYTIALQSYLNVILGLVLASLIAVPLAIINGLRKNLDEALTPNILLLGALPDLALLPLFVLWFGSGNTAAILMSGTVAFFPLYFTIREGVLAIPNELFEIATIMGASGITLYREVVLPGVWASFITGIRIAFQYLWEIIIAIEIAARVFGIGSFINGAVDPSLCLPEICPLLKISTTDVDIAFAGIIVVGVLVLFTDRVVFEKLETRVRVWREK